MAIDERRTPPERPIEPAERTSRRDDWVRFWDDPLFAFWGGTPRRPWQGQDWGLRDARSRDAREAAPEPAPAADWTPDVETFQRGEDFIVRADVPGMKRADISLHATRGALTIEGERRSQFDEEQEGKYRTERSYGRFCRVVPLPDNAAADSATATLANGVLEVVVKAPLRDVANAHRIEIREADDVPDLGTSRIYPE